MTVTLSHVNQLPPQRIARGKHLAHDHTRPAVARHATRNLRRQRQELLRHQSLLEEIGLNLSENRPD